MEIKKRTLSEDHRRKIGEGVSRARASSKTLFSLEKAPELSRSEEAPYSCQLLGMSSKGTRFEIVAIDWDGYFLLSYSEEGLEGIPANTSIQSMLGVLSHCPLRSGR